VHRPLLPLALAALLVAGCAGPGDAPASVAAGPAAQATMSIVGLVQDEDLAAVAGAAVHVRSLDASATTDAAGNFRIDGLLPSAYLVDVAAAGFENATLTAEPTATNNASLNFILSRPATLRPASEVVHFNGLLQCAAEYVIISPSCDTLLTFAGGPAVFEDTSTFDLGVRPGWSGVAVDVDFDPGSSPGLDGLRLVVRGIDDAAELNEYQQYGRFNAPQPFTAVLEPGALYEEADIPVPANTTAFRFQVYPQSHGWHATCAVGDEACTLGVGAGVDVSFDLYVTVFYNQPVPAGYSLRAA
jgi:hypothetical protein